ncbi:MAG: hypothetical protein R3F44_09940 [Candidatus Competibacteraceae bacterium]
MGWVTILYVIIGTLSTTIAGLYLGAWLVQMEAWSYLALAVLEASIVGVAGTELWMLRAQTPVDYATAPVLVPGPDLVRLRRSGGPRVSPPAAALSGAGLARRRPAHPGPGGGLRLRPDLFTPR